MIKRIIITIISILITMTSVVYATNDINLIVNGTKLMSENKPILFEGRTLTPLRAVCEALKLGISWNQENQTIKISDEFNLIVLEIGNSIITINDTQYETDIPAQIIDGHTYVPIRSIAEAFGAAVTWDGDNRVIEINQSKIPQNAPTETVTESKQVQAQTNIQPTQDAPETENTKIFSFYSQPDPQWGFENNGRGYCWVCSYAMLITNLTNTSVTPIDIATYNTDNGASSGSYITSHYGIASKYGLEFTPALDESSQYFKSYDSAKRGATYIDAQTDEDIIAALTEILQNHPNGVMVRFEGYPHTLVATHAADNTIYFNDPASEKCQNVDFSGTCLSKSFKLTDLSFVQAMKLK